MTKVDRAFFARPLAHRGLHDLSKRRPENSRAAFRAAMDASYGIELDVQVSSDGVAMVFHDEALDRLTGASGLVRARDAAELGQIPLTGGDEGIPTLGEVLAEVAGRVALLVEIKDQSGDLGPTDGVLEAAVARDLDGYDGPVAVMSFNPHAIKAVQELAPDLTLGLVTDDYNEKDWGDVPAARRASLNGLRDVEAMGLAFISHNVNDLKNPAVARLKSGGTAIFCWTVRSAAQEAEARRIVDNITFENYPAV